MHRRQSGIQVQVALLPPPLPLCPSVHLSVYLTCTDIRMSGYLFRTNRRRRNKVDAN